MNPKMKILITRDVKAPVRGTSKSAGLDFYIPNDFSKTGLMVAPGEHLLIKSGVYAKVPEGYALIAMNKSGIARSKSLQVSAGVVDEDYQGEIHLHVINIGEVPCAIKAGEKLLQMLLVPVLYADTEIVDSIQELYEGEITERGEGNFGSTGAV